MLPPELMVRSSPSDAEGSSQHVPDSPPLTDEGSPSPPLSPPLTNSPLLADSPPLEDSPILIGTVHKLLVKYKISGQWGDLYTVHVHCVQM